MLASLKRRDQRARGEWYISGLLSVPGRKSMRALAAVAGYGAAEQSLHHFISD
ncbi:transposase, partial [Kitasatospora nipponensis]